MKLIDRFALRLFAKRIAKGLGQKMAKEEPKLMADLAMDLLEQVYEENPVVTLGVIQDIKMQRVGNGSVRYTEHGGERPLH